MSINRHAYRAIEAVVGKNYITDDPADCEGYRSGPGGYESGTGYERIMTRLPGAIVMPRTTEDVQKIVKICGRYGLPFVPYSTGFYGPRSHPHMDDELIIDMKRMRVLKSTESTSLSPCSRVSPTLRFSRNALKRAPMWW